MKSAILALALLSAASFAHADTLIVQTGTLKTTYQGVVIKADRAYPTERIDFGSWSNSTVNTVYKPQSYDRHATLKINGAFYSDCIVLGDEVTAQYPRTLIADCLPQ